jgi:hypothetical protein
VGDVVGDGVGDGVGGVGGVGTPQGDGVVGDGVGRLYRGDTA